MRLACPKCDARYEVPEDAIPASGRDVQCSNCGHAWFQMPPAEDGADAVPPGAATHLPPDTAPDTPADTPAAPAPAPARPAPTQTAPAGEAARPGLDADVVAVLREEAEHEAGARREEARREEARRAAARRAAAEEQMQVQPDLGLSAPAPAQAQATAAPPDATDRRVRMLRGEDPDAPPAPPPRIAARRDLLPDVDDINSTLLPGAGLDADAEVDALPDLNRGHAFRGGFIFALLVLALAVAIYVLAPAIGARLPQVRAPLDAYVAFVDGLRAWLEGLMTAATDRLGGTAREGG